MDKNQKAIRSLIENHLIYSNDSRERKNLIEIYHSLEPQETKSELKSKMGIIYLGMAGIAVALSLLAHLITR